MQNSNSNPIKMAKGYYTPRPSTTDNITKGELQMRLSIDLGYSNDEARAIVDTLLNCIIDGMHKGKNCTLLNFGRIELKEVKGKNHYNPIKGCVEKTKDYHKYVFKPSPPIRQAVKYIKQPKTE